MAFRTILLAFAMLVLLNTLAEGKSSFIIYFVAFLTNLDAKCNFLCITNVLIVFQEYLLFLLHHHLVRMDPLEMIQRFLLPHHHREMVTIMMFNHPHPRIALVTVSIRCYRYCKTFIVKVYKAQGKRFYLYITTLDGGNEWIPEYDPICRDYSRRLCSDFLRPSCKSCKTRKVCPKYCGVCKSTVI